MSYWVVSVMMVSRVISRWDGIDMDDMMIFLYRENGGMGSHYFKHFDEDDAIRRERRVVLSFSVT
jgi:hypothetical protein